MVTGQSEKIPQLFKISRSRDPIEFSLRASSKCVGRRKTYVRSLRGLSIKDQAMSPIVVIVGRPNVGKSTLFNRLSKSRDALVDDFPGVTRDTLYSSVQYDGGAFTLVDTGGVDEGVKDPLLKQVRDHVKRAIEVADSVLFMVDAREGLMPGDYDIAEILRRSQKKVILAANKVDGPEHDHLASEFYGLGVETLYPVSSAHGYGISSLVDEIVKDFPQDEFEQEDDGRIRVAVVGRPNVGKSSLINRILGRDRLLVSEEAGTTRDAVDTPFDYSGNHYLLIDTAGMRRKAKVKDKIDNLSMIKALRSLDRCHVALIMLDAERGVSEQDARICGYAFEKGRALVLAVNKWDLIKGDAEKRRSMDNAIDRQLQFIHFVPRINISALTGERVMKAFEKIDLVYGQFCRRISTPAVNKAIRDMIVRHPPPGSERSRGRLKFFYATQVAIRPPTFVLFVNRPSMIHFSYKRFLMNQLRTRFSIENIPIRLKFKKK